MPSSSWLLFIVLAAAARAKSSAFLFPLRRASSPTITCSTAHDRTALHIRDGQRRASDSWIRLWMSLGSASSDERRQTTPSPSSSSSLEQAQPMAFGSGYSTLPDLKDAIREAVAMASASLPRDAATIDAGWISVSSLYDGGAHSPATTVVPAVLQALGEEVGGGGSADQQPRQLRHLIGSSVAGCISSSSRTVEAEPSPSASSSVQSDSTIPQCRPVEFEGVPSVSITLAVLPGVVVESFCVSSSDVPDGDFRQSVSHPEWNRAIGLSRIVSPSASDGSEGADPLVSDSSSSPSSPPPVFYLLPSPAFAADLDTLVSGMEHYYPGSQVVGGVASTVSSLSRAKLYRWSSSRRGGGSSSSSSSTLSFSCVTEGCVGLALQGDVAVRQMTAMGAKPVGGIYQVLRGSDSSISVIVLDEVATDALQDESLDEPPTLDQDGDQDGADDSLDPRQKMSELFAKARIPKPVLAEANFLMRTLSDDDQAFMRRQLLIGLEQGGSVGRTANELARLASGQGHCFAIHQVASAGMKDGSVTFPLGSVSIEPGTRMRFFVREAEFAKKEFEALWTGYKKSVLDDQFSNNAKSKSFNPAACFVVPTLDRGSKFFLGKPGYEGGTVARMLPGVTSISGFFSNGVIGRIDAGSGDRTGSSSTGVQGSASGYFLWGSRSNRPVYSPAAAAAEAAARQEQRDTEEREARALAEDDAKRVLLSAKKSSSSMLIGERAPRSEDGELVLKRREVHSGRALTVSTVEWSVAEKLAKPSSALEGFMWEKETEVDRFRERVPLANLVSQCRQSASDPTVPKPRDWVGPLKRAVEARGFAIVPECKRMEPTTGSLRRRYDIAKLIREFTLAGVPAISVNCDGVLFGGSLDDVTAARQAASAAAVEQLSDDDGVVVPPILASDLVLYPYQLYKLRLAGADAVNLLAGALARKDLTYLTKIASSLQFQTLVTVTSEVQIRSLLDLPVGAVDALIVSNRDLEDFSFDMTGEQALGLLRCGALEELRQKMGSDLPVLVEGRIGIIERCDSSGTKSTKQYIEELKGAGASGAVVGGGLAAATLATAETLDELSLLST